MELARMYELVVYLGNSRIELRKFCNSVDDAINHAELLCCGMDGQKMRMKGTIKSLSFNGKEWIEDPNGETIIDDSMIG